MNELQALGAFGALSQETRLRIIRMLVVAGGVEFQKVSDLIQGIY